MKNDMTEKIKGITDQLQDYIVDIGTEENPKFIIGGKGIDKSAKEISTLFKDYYPREFLEWIIFSDKSPFWYEKRKGKNMYWHEELDKYFNLDYVYKYWQDNIKDK